jgi:peptidoglycan glycosyltransferase
MLRNDVEANYGDENFPGLDLRAKSGTAETGDGGNSHAWFYGYSGDHAFVVMVENGGAGAAVALIFAAFTGKKISAV